MKRKSREQKLQLATETLCQLDQPLSTVIGGAGTTSINPGGTAGCGCTCNSRNTCSSIYC